MVELHIQLIHQHALWSEAGVRLYGAMESVVNCSMNTILSDLQVKIMVMKNKSVG